MVYARWVWVTSFERPVVPEVGIRTAGSSWVAGPGPSSPPGSANSSSTPVSSTTSAGSTWPIRPFSSVSVWRGSTATWIAPRYAVASQRKT